MIQVLERAFRILEELALDGEVSLENLTRLTEINKGTLCNILKTLVQLDYVVKTGRGSYALSERFRAMGGERALSPEEGAMLHAAAESLSRELGESIVLATLHGDRIAILAQSQASRRLVVNEVICYARLSLYHSVSGRIILAHLPAESREQLFLRNGPPGAEWEGVTSLAGLEEACCRLREQGLSVMSNEEDGIKSFAVPVFDGAGKIAFALGVTLPVFRLPADGGTRMVQRLKRKADHLTEEMQLREFRAEQFLRLPRYRSGDPGLSPIMRTLRPPSGKLS